MVFNSIEFILFIAVVGLIYYLLNRSSLVKWRNAFLLGASWLFYGLFQWWFLGLLIYIIVVNYFGGIVVANAKSNKQLKIGVVIVLSLAVLAFMKYAYLVNESIILPVGLSFFTFQALAYSIDIYRGKINAERNFVDVALYISFLPTVLSGPIERARNLMPQLKGQTPMTYDNMVMGAKIFILGLFKKAVIADRLAIYVNEIYTFPAGHTGATLALAALFYSIQIYCDFSGYADMAIGTGRALGFKIMENFRFPYFAMTIKDFWRRWHISLTSWFTEYVYISLGGNRVNKLRWVFNIMAIFLLSGIWHGATAAFVIWGGIHAVAYLIEHYLKIDKPNFLYGLVCFVVVTLAWVFFRIEDSSLAATVVGKIFTDFFSTPKLMLNDSTFSFIVTLALLAIFTVREVMAYRKSPQSAYVANVEAIFLLLMVALFAVSSGQFVYFQF